MGTGLEVPTLTGPRVSLYEKLNFNLETCVMAQILSNFILINNYITTYPVKSISTCLHVIVSIANNAFIHPKSCNIPVITTFIAGIIN